MPDSKLVNGRVDALKAVEWIFRLATLVLIPVLFFLWGQVAELNVAIARMEGNRFTSGDGLAVWQAIEGKADRDAVPPPWFLERVAVLEERVRELERGR